MSDSRSRLSDEDLAATAQRLSRLEHENGWFRILEIGTIILECVYRGDIETCKERRGQDSSLRRLADHPECPMKKSALSEAIGIYIVALEEPDIRRLERITPSHVACVLNVDSVERRQLLTTANDQAMSVRALSERVRAARYHTESMPVPTLPDATLRNVITRYRKGLELLETARTLFDSAISIPTAQARDISDTLRSIELCISASRAILMRSSRPIRLSPLEIGARNAAMTMDQTDKVE